MAGKEDHPTKNFGAVGLGSACAPAEKADAAAADLESGGLRACSASRRTLVEKELEQEVATGGKRKAEDSEVSAADVTAEVSAAASAAAAGEVFVDEATGIKYVDMPDSFLRWILSQQRLSPSPYDPRQCTWMSPEEIEREVASVERIKALQKGVSDRFFKFQAWVRETYQTKGRVLVPEGFTPHEFLLSQE